MNRTGGMQLASPYSLNYDMSSWHASPQRFYRLDVTCHPCPDLAWLLILAFCAAITLLLIIGVWLNQRRINLAALGIGVDFAQVRCEAAATLAVIWASLRCMSGC